MRGEIFLEEDISLVEEILNGNIDSFNILINKYELIVLKFVYGIIKDKEASEDITQEVFITIYNKLYQYDKNYKFSNWLLQIAKNKAFDYVRKFKRVYEANIEECIGAKDLEPSPEDKLEYKETKELVRSFINNLDEIDRQIFILRYSSEKTFCEISVILGINESTIKRRYYKGKAAFFKLYKSNKYSLGGENYGL